MSPDKAVQTTSSFTVNIAPLPKFEDTAPQCGVYYLNPVAHTGDYFTGPLGTGKDPSVIQ
jgi:hypothetical protein